MKTVWDPPPGPPGHRASHRSRGRPDRAGPRLRRLPCRRGRGMRSADRDHGGHPPAALPAGAGRPRHRQGCFVAAGHGQGGAITSDRLPTASKSAADQEPARRILVHSGHAAHLWCRFRGRYPHATALWCSSFLGRIQGEWTAPGSLRGEPSAQNGTIPKAAEKHAFAGQRRFSPRRRRSAPSRGGLQGDIFSPAYVPATLQNLSSRFPEAGIQNPGSFCHAPRHQVPIRSIRLLDGLASHTLRYVSDGYAVPERVRGGVVRPGSCTSRHLPPREGS